jgi:hypothetical protein
VPDEVLRHNLCCVILSPFELGSRRPSGMRRTKGRAMCCRWREGDRGQAPDGFRYAFLLVSIRPTWVKQYPSEK